MTDTGAGRPLPAGMAPFRGLFDLAGRVAIVPGATGGLGEAVAFGLAAYGARVVVSGRDAARADALAGRLAAAGFDALGLAMDLRSVAAIRDAVDAAAERMGGLDLLVNCAGIHREEGILEVTEAAFDEVYAVDLKAAMFLAQAAARHQTRRPGGRQVHLLSVRSTLGLRGRGYSAYCAAKGGLAMLVRQHAMELAPHGITVNGVAPTFVPTALNRAALEDEAFRSRLLERIPLGRLGEPLDVVGAVLFFCMPAAAFVTGQILHVDGGITAGQ